MSTIINTRCHANAMFVFLVQWDGEKNMCMPALGGFGDKCKTPREFLGAAYRRLKTL